MGHALLLRDPRNSIHFPPCALVAPMFPSPTPGAAPAVACGELVRSSRR